jgi:hypothetical protein
LQLTADQGGGALQGRKRDALIEEDRGASLHRPFR